MDIYVLDYFKNNFERECNIAKKWLPPITECDKIILMNILTGNEATIGIPLIVKYIEFLRPYTEILGITGENNKPREADCVASGIVFFYGCLFYIMHFPGWGNHIEDIFLYNLLYIMVDHYIDDININDESKDGAIRQMYIIIMDPLSYKNMILIDPVLKVIAETYNKLITKCPTTRNIIIKLFETEIEGLSLQKNPSLPRDKYYEIAKRKGGYTMQVLYNIVNPIHQNSLNDQNWLDATFDSGICMQLIDDAIDCLQDLKNGIHTIATHDLITKGNLDDLWVDIINRINNMDDRFTVFKILYMIFAVYVPDRNRENFSQKLWSKTNKLNLFDYSYGCDGARLLIETIMNELKSFDNATSN